MSKNIEMNYFNGNEYEVLYPSVTMGNIGDWNDYVYSKSKVDNIINPIRSTANTALSTAQQAQSTANRVSSKIGNYSVTKIGSYVLGRSQTLLFTLTTLYQFLYMSATDSSSYQDSFSCSFKIGGTGGTWMDFGLRAILVLGSNSGIGYYMENYQFKYDLNYSDGSWPVYGYAYNNNGATLTVYGITLV